MGAGLSFWCGDSGTGPRRGSASGAGGSFSTGTGAKAVAMEWVKYYLARFFELDTFRVVSGTLLGILLAVIESIHTSVWIFIGMFFLDTLLGYLAARKRGVANSNRMRAGVWKLLLYIVTIGAAAMADRAFFGKVPDFGLWYLTVGYCVATEFKSVLENVERLGGNVPSFLLQAARAFEKRFDKGDRNGEI